MVKWWIYQRNRWIYWFWPPCVTNSVGHTHTLFLNWATAVTDLFAATAALGFASPPSSPGRLRPSTQRPGNCARRLTSFTRRRSGRHPSTLCLATPGRLRSAWCRPGPPLSLEVPLPTLPAFAQAKPVPRPRCQRPDPRRRPSVSGLCPVKVSIFSILYRIWVKFGWKLTMIEWIWMKFEYGRVILDESWLCY
jgi:hypothetical protein